MTRMGRRKPASARVDDLVEYLRKQVYTDEKLHRLLHEAIALPQARSEKGAKLVLGMLGAWLERDNLTDAISQYEEQIKTAGPNVTQLKKALAQSQRMQTENAIELQRSAIMLSAFCKNPPRDLLDGARFERPTLSTIHQRARRYRNSFA